ncbi:MAG: PAS domain S-box protein [Candidatus Lokiarchaeota archaeon]|nr:PAS domain S-box protein [Candidatus Lokiarchaeota archaeon]
MEYKKRFDSLSFAIILLDLDGKIKLSNIHFNKLFDIDFNDYYMKNLISILSLSKITNIQIEDIIKETKNTSIFGPKNIEIKFNNNPKFFTIFGSQIKIKNELFIQLIFEENQRKDSFNFTQQTVLGILILQENKIKYVNNRFCDLIEYNMEEIKSWNLEELKRIFFKGHLIFILEQIKKKQKGIKDNINCFQVKYVKKTKQTFWVENIIETINYEENPAVLISVLDITKEKEAENLIIEENKRLKDLDIIRKNFLDRASHELKTPLTSVYGASQLLRQIINKNYKDQKKYFKELVDIINEGSEKLTKLISNLLDISRLESTKLKLEKTNTDIINLIENCISEVNYLIKKRNHTIIKELPEKFNISIDKSRIERVITNLLINAINYTPSGGIIKVKFRKFEKNIEISVIDSGIGISEEDLKKMFNKFVHIEKPDDEYDIKLDGTGLGLYISKEIIELHKGKIYAESKGLKKGSSFKFELPIN